MKEIRDILRAYNDLKDSGQSLALATVFDVKGSSYRRTGARMLISDSGSWFGGISGGCIEGNALKKAQMVMADGIARIVTYDTENDDEASIGVSLGCNGVISLIITPLNLDLAYDPMKKLTKILGSRRTEILLTVLETTVSSLPAGSVMGLDDLGKVSGASNAFTEIDAIAVSGKSKVVVLNSMKIFAEAIQPDIHLMVMGGNYDIYPLLQIADNLSWKKTIVSNPKRVFTSAKGLADEIVADLEEVEIDRHCVGVVMSHDYQADLKNLGKALNSDLQYIGVLGPAVRRQDMINELRANGQNIDESRIYGPAGLDIGALQPEEIAVAIVSEIISVLRNREARSLRERLSTIHER